MKAITFEEIRESRDVHVIKREDARQKMMLRYLRVFLCRRSPFFAVLLTIALVAGSCFAVPLTALAEEQPTDEPQVQTEELQTLNSGEELVFEEIPLVEELPAAETPQEEDLQVQTLEAQDFNTLAENVCEINGVFYTSIEEAIAYVKKNETIKLLTDITCEDGLIINDSYSYKDGFTIDVGEYTLTAGSKGLDEYALYIKYGKVKLERTTGAFNVISGWRGVYAFDAEITVSNVTVSRDNGGEGTCYGVYNADSSVTVLGDVIMDVSTTGMDLIGVYTGAEGLAKTVVGGDVEVNGGSTQYGVQGSWNSETEIKGSISVNGSKYYGYGIYTEANPQVWVGGDVTCVGDAAISARDEARIFVKGNVTCEVGKGVNMMEESETTIDGVMTAKEGQYVVIGDARYFSIDDFITPTTKEGYLTYRDVSEQPYSMSTTWVKIPGDPGEGPETFTVTFDSQGGTHVASLTGVLPNAAISEPKAPKQTGYTFGGWYKEAACENAWNFASDHVTGNMTLYAKWAPVNTGGNEGQGGSGSIDRKSFAVPALTPVPAPIPTPAPTIVPPVSIDAAPAPLAETPVPAATADLPQTGHEPFPWYLIFAGLGLVGVSLLTYRKVCAKR